MTIKPAKLTIVYPAPGQKITFGRPGIFVYGSAPRGNAVTVNGARAKMHKSGAWLAYVPTKAGKFSIIAAAQNLRRKRTVYIAPSAPTKAKRKPLKAAPYRKPCLKPAQLKVFLDPGHSPRPTYPGEGKTSPLGIYEHTINYKLALAAARALRLAGAKVKISKTFKEQLPNLITRTQRAQKWGADIFISLHHNSWPDNVNPFKQKNGYSFYYYYPNGKQLAGALQSAYRAHIKELPDEGLKRANFAVLRNSPSIPAVLVESAYITLPAHEELLLKPAFITKLARAIAKGARAWAKQI